jgi:Mg-chelatase subunit ChlD
MKILNFKRLLSMFLAIIIFFTSNSMIVLASTIPSNWAISEISKSKQVNIITDKIEDDYQKNITREEFCELIVRLYTALTGVIPDVVNNNFTDTDNEDISRAYGIGVVYGMSNERFAPNNNITRQEICTMIVRCIEKSISDVDVNIYSSYDEIADEYIDLEQVSEWAQPSIFYALDNGIMKGIGTSFDKKIDPLNSTTREQAVLLAYRVYENKESLVKNKSTNLLMDDDMDSDDLLNEDEINKYGTNPKLSDTDGDGSDDGWEVFYGTNPLVAEEKFTQTKTTGKIDENTPIVASTTITLDGEQVGSLEVTPITMEDEYLLSPIIPGYLGNAYDFSVDGTFENADISFEYDTSLGVIGDNFQPRIYYFDENNSVLEELPNQSVVNGCVTATVTHFSKYILLNSIEFSLAWDNDIRKPSENYNDSSILTNMDIVFVIDESGSMENASMNKSGGQDSDPDRLRVDAVKKFIDEMAKEDRASVIGFSSEARELIGFTNDKEQVKTQADNIVGNLNGTALYKGLDMAIEKFKNNSGNETDRIIIALSDGYDEPDAPNGVYDKVISDALNNNITIYTVGLGDNAASILLTDIAQNTGGKYYHASVAENLYEGFDLVKDETIDYKKDSNGDGISDYFAQLIFEGKLLMSNGSREFLGMDFESKADFDGDGLLNGEEIKIVEFDGQVMAYMISDPTFEDTDFDGFDDRNDPHPLYRDFFSTDSEDFRFLTDDSYYKYSKEADDYDGDFWKKIGDETVTTLSFTDMQKEYTEEMANFFIENANEEYVNNFAMTEMEEFIKNNTYDDINIYINSIEIFTNSLDEIIREDKIIKAGEKIMEAKKNLASAIKEGRKSKSIAGYKSWVTRRNNNLEKIDKPVFKFIKKGLPDKTIKSMEFAEASGNLLGYVFLGYDVYEFIEDEMDIWAFAQGIANNNAQNEIFKSNEDIFINLSLNAKHNFTSKAAKFVLQSMYQSYAEVFSQMYTNLNTVGAGIGVSIILMFSTAPAALIVGTGLAVFGILDTVFGWSDSSKTRGRIICLSDMTESVVYFTNKYYLTGNESFGRHLENLVNLRITGERRFIQLYENNVDRNSECLGAEQNIEKIVFSANKIGLFVIE